jgi:hypothetical protein
MFGQYGGRKMILQKRKRAAHALFSIGVLSILAACGEPRAVMLPLQYPDGSAVVSHGGEPIMAGYQTYGTAMHGNATALYDRAAPATCTTCTHVGMVVSEPSNFRQVTGLLGVSTVGAGAVMGGLGMMTYGNAAEEGKLGTNVSQNDSSQNSISSQSSSSSQSSASLQNSISSQNSFSDRHYAGGNPHYGGGDNHGGGGHYADGGGYGSGGYHDNNYANNWNQYGGY